MMKINALIEKFLNFRKNLSKRNKIIAYVLLGVMAVGAVGGAVLVNNGGGLKGSAWAEVSVSCEGVVKNVLVINDGKWYAVVDWNFTLHDASNDQENSVKYKLITDGLVQANTINGNISTVKYFSDMKDSGATHVEATINNVMAGEETITGYCNKLDLNIPKLPNQSEITCKISDNINDNGTKIPDSIVVKTTVPPDTNSFSISTYKYSLSNGTIIPEHSNDTRVVETKSLQNKITFTPTVKFNYASTDKWMVLMIPLNKEVDGTPCSYNVSAADEQKAAFAADAALAKIDGLGTKISDSLKTIKSYAKKAADALSIIKTGKAAPVALFSLKANPGARGPQTPADVSDVEIGKQIQIAKGASDDAIQQYMYITQSVKTVIDSFDTIPKDYAKYDQAKSIRDTAFSNKDTAEIQLNAASKSYNDAVTEGNKKISDKGQKEQNLAELKKSNDQKKADIQNAADAAKNDAKSAASEAKSQKSIAVSAAKKAENDANLIQTVADNISSDSSPDQAASLIKKAQGLSDDAQSQADTAKAAADEASSQADSISDDAALSSIKDAAQADADAAQTAADDAQTSADSAKSILLDAQITADQVASDAKQALKDAADQKAAEDAQAAKEEAAQIAADSKQAAADKKLADAKKAADEKIAYEKMTAEQKKAADAQKAADEIAAKTAAEDKKIADAEAAKAADAAKAARASKCPGVYYPTDIAKSPYQDSIKAAYDACIVKGYGDETYKPTKHLTRAEATKIVLLAGGHDAKTGCYDRDCGSPFVDLETWQGPFVRAAYDLAIVSGYGVHFIPNRDITRGEAVALITKGLGIDPHPGCTTNNCGAGFPDNFFKDIKLTWQGPYLRALWDKGVISADNKGMFYPDVAITRGQIIEWVMKLKGY